MTQPPALISQPDDEKNHLFLAAYLKPQHHSNTNQGLFLPLSPTIFRKLRCFLKGIMGFFPLFQEGFVKSPLSDAARAGTHTELKRYARPWLPWKDCKARKQSSVGCLRGKRQLFSSSNSCPFHRTHLEFPVCSPRTKVLLQS